MDCDPRSSGSRTAHWAQAGAYSHRHFERPFVALDQDWAVSGTLVPKHRVIGGDSGQAVYKAYTSSTQLSYDSQCLSNFGNLTNDAGLHSKNSYLRVDGNKKGAEWHPFISNSDEGRQQLSLDIPSAVRVAASDAAGCLCAPFNSDCVRKVTANSLSSLIGMTRLHLT